MAKEREWRTIMSTPSLKIAREVGAALVRWWYEARRGTFLHRDGGKMAEKRLFDYAVGEQIHLHVLLKGVERRVSKNGKQYLILTFADKSGEVIAMYWDPSSEDLTQLVPGAVVLLTGSLINYQDNRQVRITRLEPVTTGAYADPGLYMPTAPEAPKEMANEFKEYIEDITDPDWQKIIYALLHKYQKDFFTYPAAKKNHHAFVAGLAYHTLSILRLAKAVTQQYQHVNASLLYAGAILHDLGKTLELSGPVGTEYTLAGNLLGHIVLVDEEIIKVCDETGIDTKKENIVLLRHMILAHHGLLEYGSPVRPHLLEADVLHQLDELDASIQMVRSALEKTEPGEFSGRIFAKDNLKFYRPQNWPDQSEQQDE